MSYESDHLSTAVRKARVRLGLSQRELSGISGVQQAQISKFENGTVDLRLSSLVALFRALELELELVPRTCLPAVQSIIRTTSPKSTISRKLSAQGKIAVDHVMQGLTQLDQTAKQVQYLQELIRFLERIRIPADQAKNYTRWVKYLEQFHAMPIDAEKFEALLKRTEALRNQIERSQSPRNQSLSEKPAYSLDEEDGHV